MTRKLTSTFLGKANRPAWFSAAAVALLAFSVGSQAATVSYSGSYNGDTDVSDWVINVAQFDPSLGTLVSATFDLDATMHSKLEAGTLVFDNPGFHIEPAVDVTYNWTKDTAYFTLIGASPYDSMMITADMSGWNGNGSDVYGVIDAPDLHADGSFAGSPLSAFIGTGNLDFFLTTENYNTFSVSNGLTTRLSTDIAAAVTVTYEYTPVPVPAAAWLFGSGIGILGMFRRRMA